MKLEPEALTTPADDPDGDLFHARGIDGLILWRDGNLAVVSLGLKGRIFRVLEADAREMFYEDCTAGELRALSKEDSLQQNDFRRGRNAKRPAPPEVADLREETNGH